MKDLYTYYKEVHTLLGSQFYKILPMVLLFLIASIIDVVSISLIGPYISMILQFSSTAEIPTYIKQLTSFFNTEIRHDYFLLTTGSVVLVMFFLRLTVGLLIQTIILRYSYKQQVRLQCTMMSTYQSIAYSQFISRNSSEHISSIQIFTRQFSLGVLLPSLKIISDGAIAVGILIFLAYNNPWMSIILVSLLFGLVFSYDKLFRRRLKAYGRNSNTGASQVTQSIQEAMHGFKEIRILGVEQLFFQNMRSGAETYSSNLAKQQIIRAAPRFLADFLLVGFVVILVTGYMTHGAQPEIVVPMLATFGIAALRLVPAINSLSSNVILLRFSRDAVSRLHNDLVLAQPNSHPTSTDIRPLTNNFDTFNVLSVSNISYKYPGSTRPSLDNITLSIAAGDSIGIVGASGSGKTTLVDVLLGLLVPQEGLIKFNGVPLSESAKIWQSCVAYLPQEIFLTDQSLRSNIALGVPEDSVDSDLLEKSIQRAQLADLIIDLPDGVDTNVGERGISISGGQRQRVALARAFYHKRNVLVMDEATSSLDAHTELEIVDEIRRLKRKQTIIVIAHRLSTVKYCDRIYRLDRGSIVESGTFDELFPLAQSN
jgi:ATP-binding cassette, subfamily B, bacterial PglK